MKNKFRYFIIITFFILTGPNLSYGEELLIKALKVETFEEGNIIHATGEAEAKTQDGLEIFANIFQYNKDQGLLIASGEVKVLDLKNQVILKSELIHYTEIDNKITTYDNTDINIKDEYFIETKNLNYKFRKKNRATDVLSFPFYTQKNLKKKLKKEKEIYLGDIIISLDKINFKESLKNFKFEFEKLWIHGLVHLFGHDHKNEKDFKKMHKVEKNYLKYIK